MLTFRRQNSYMDAFCQKTDNIFLENVKIIGLIILENVKIMTV